MTHHEGEGHGMWHSVNKALGGLFGSGLSDERRMEVEVLFGLIGFLAKSDGLITSYENDFAAKMLDDLGLNNAAAEIAMGAFRVGTLHDFNVESEVARFTAVHKLGSDEMSSLFESLLKLALSDGRVYPRERMALERLAKAFGIPVKSLDLRLDALRR